MRVQTKISKRVAHIEALVGAVIGEGWVEVVNAERVRDGRRPYRAGVGDERAALALFAHAPGVRDRWNAPARIASQLGGILNAAHHNDADRWAKGDADRAAQLAEALIEFLDQHPADAMTTTWTVDVELGELGARKRKPVRVGSGRHTGAPGQPLAEVADNAAGQAGAPGSVRALAALAAAIGADRAAAHLRVELRDSTSTPTQTATVVARRSDTENEPLTVSVSL